MGSIRGVVTRHPRGARRYAWLASHCDVTRDLIARPWSEGGRTWASNGYYMVSIPGRHAAPGGPTRPHPEIYVPPNRPPDATYDLAPLRGRDVSDVCARCLGTGRLACELCMTTGHHTCECGEEHACGGCDGTGRHGPCRCDGARIESQTQLCVVAGVTVRLAYMVRLAPCFAGPVRAWCLRAPFSVLILEDFNGTRATVIECLPNSCLPVPALESLTPPAVRKE